MPSPPIRQRGLMRLITAALASHGWFCGWWGRLWVDFIFPEGGRRRSFVLFHHYQLNLSWIRSTVSQDAQLQGDRFNFLTSSRLRSQTCISTCRQRSATKSRQNEDTDDTEMSIQRDNITALPGGTREGGATTAIQWGFQTAVVKTCNPPAAATRQTQGLQRSCKGAEINNQAWGTKTLS